MLKDKKRRVMWVNTFVRDILLILVIAAMQYYTNFNSKVVFFITGMMAVWVSWQITDFINENRRIVE